jgi:predicted neutral ceramidase superfamily lipid hydrolase
VFSVLIPAFIISGLKRFKNFRYSLFTGLVGLAVFLFFSVLGLFFSEVGFKSGVVVLAVIASALVYLLWFVVLFFAFDLKFKSFILSFIQPVLFLFFILFWKFTGFLQPVAFNSFTLLLQLLVTILIFLLVLWSLEIVINAPTKRNFGVSAVQVSRFFMSQWLNGGRELETLFSISSEKVNTIVSVVSFKNNGLKGLFVIPTVHYGPLGTLGGSAFPYLISKHFEEKYGCPVIVFKGAANHDFNPVSASSVKIINDEVESLLKKGVYSSKISFLRSKVGTGMVNGFDVGGKAFLTFSNAPSPTEDIDQTIGFALRNRALAFFKDAVIVDRHNSRGKISFFGSDVFERLTKSVETLKKSKSSSSLKIGFAETSIDSKQVGKAGLKVAIIEGAEKHCLIVFDANNCTPDFREKLLKSVKGFDFVDVFTTDSHYVNLVKGIHNPLTDESLIPIVVETVEKARKNVESCKAKLVTGSIKINVLGTQKSSEFIGTINALISMVKIIVPFLFFVGIVLSLIMLLFLK